MSEIQCSVPDQFGPHGGKQMRSPKYMYCGCDVGYCEAHTSGNPFIPYEAGEPRKCKKHRGAAPRAPRKTGGGTE